MPDLANPFGSRLAWASAQCPSTNNNVLLHLNLAGGMDAANALVPTNCPSYFTKRPTLAVRNPISLSGVTGLGLHPNLVNLQQLFNSGNVAFVTKVGYPHQVSSHADGTRNFARAMFGNDQDPTGWAGRIADLFVECGMSDRFTIMSLGGRARDVEGLKYVPIVANSLLYFETPGNYFSSPAEDAFKNKIWKEMRAIDEQDKPVQKSFMNAYDVVADAGVTLKNVAQAYDPAGYPDSAIGQTFKNFARLVHYGIYPKVVYTGMGGYDNHSGQKPVFDERMATLDAAIGRLVTDLKSMGKFNQVIISIESEFSRCLFENESLDEAGRAAPGTDHGGAIMSILIGGKIRGGIYGPGWLESDFATRASFLYSIDFREMRSRLVEWLGIDPKLVFPGTFANAGVASQILSV